MPKKTDKKAQDRSKQIRIGSLILVALGILLTAFLTELGQDVYEVVKRFVLIETKPHQQIALDLSQGQNQWDDLTAWIKALEPEVLELREPFRAHTLRKLKIRVLILPLPFHEHLPDAKIHDLVSWVENGGGLLFLGHYAADIHHGSNPSQLGVKWGIRFRPQVLLPEAITDCQSGRVHARSVSAKYAVDIPRPDKEHPLLKNVKKISLVSSTALELDPNRKAPGLVLWSNTTTNVCTAVAVPGTCGPDGTSCSVNWVLSDKQVEPVIAAYTYGGGRVVVIGTWKVAYSERGDNQAFLHNVFRWLAKH